MRDAIIRVFSIACIFLFIHKPSNLWLYILIVSGSGIFGNLSLWPYLIKSVRRIPFKQLHFSRHLKPAVILFIPTVSIQLYIMINKIMLKNMVSVQAAGFMDYSDSFINASMILVTSLSMVLLPRITNLFANNKIEAIHQSLYKSFQFITALAVPLMFGLAVVAPHFTVWFLTPKFAVTGTLLIIQTPIILLIAWNNTIGKQYLLPVNRMRDYTLSIVNGVFVNLVANYFCIHYLGVYGAAVATVLTEIFVTGYQIIAVRHQLNLSLMFHDFGKFFLAGVLMAGILLFTTYLLPLRLLSFIFEISLGVLIYSLLLYLMRTDLILQLIKRAGIDHSN